MTTVCAVLWAAAMLHWWMATFCCSLWTLWNCAYCVLVVVVSTTVALFDQLLHTDRTDLQRVVCIVQVSDLKFLPATFTAAANDQHLLHREYVHPVHFSLLARLIVFLHLKLIFHLLSSASSGNSSSFTTYLPTFFPTIWTIISITLDSSSSLIAFVCDFLLFSLLSFFF